MQKVCSLPTVSYSADLDRYVEQASFHRGIRALRHRTRLTRHRMGWSSACGTRYDPLKLPIDMGSTMYCIAVLEPPMINTKSGRHCHENAGVVHIVDPGELALGKLWLTSQVGLDMVSFELIWRLQNSGLT